MTKIKHQLPAAAALAVIFAVSFGVFEAAHRAGHSDGAHAPAVATRSYRPLYLEAAPDAGSPTTSVVTTEGTTTVGGAPVVVLPDPVLQPGDTMSLFAQWWRGGQIPQALFLAGFIVAVFASKRIEWLREGHRAVWMSALVMGLGMIVEAATRGASPNLPMVMAVTMTVLAKVMNPNAPEAAQGMSVSRALQSPPQGHASDPTEAAIEEHAQAMYAGYGAGASGSKAAWSTLELSERARWRAAAKVVWKP